VCRKTPRGQTVIPVLCGILSNLVKFSAVTQNQPLFGQKTAPQDHADAGPMGHVERPQSESASNDLQFTRKRLVPPADRPRAWDRSRDRWAVCAVGKTSHFDRRHKIGDTTRIERSRLALCATKYALEGFSEPLAYESSSISTARNNSAPFVPSRAMLDRSKKLIFKAQNCLKTAYKGVVPAQITDLKSVDPKGSCGFESRHRYQEFEQERFPDLIRKPFSRFEDEER
jgi:hypothetical protein